MAEEIRIFRATLVVPISLGRGMTEDDGKTEPIEVVVSIGGTTTIISTMVAGGVGVLIETGSGTGICTVGNSYHCEKVDAEPLCAFISRCSMRRWRPFGSTETKGWEHSEASRCRRRDSLSDAPSGEWHLLADQPEQRRKVPICTLGRR